MDFRITYKVLGEFSKDEAQILQNYGDILNRSDAGVFNVRMSLVWHQFQLGQDKVTGRWLSAACLVNFLDSLTLSAKKRSHKMVASYSLEQSKQYNTGLSLHFVLSFIELIAFKHYCRANRNRRNVFILLQIDNNNTNREWPAFDCTIIFIALD